MATLRRPVGSASGSKGSRVMATGPWPNTPSPWRWRRSNASSRWMARFRSGNWRLMRAEEIHGSTFGVVGLGGIGRETARLANALGARTIGWSRSGSAGDAPVEMMALDEVLAHSDIVSLHLALTPETAGFIDAGALSKMKPGAILINTARAGIVEEGRADVRARVRPYRALRAGRVPQRTVA